jgi:hypothetical protein
MDRCHREIAEIEALIRTGHPDLQGLLLGLADWSAELRLLGKMRRMARPETKIDVVELEKLCSMQCTDEEIAAFFGVSKKTIERRRKVPRYREIMDNAKAKGRVSVRRYLFRLAANGNVAAAIFLSKNLLGYRDVLSNEHSGPAQAPLTITVKREDIP